MNTHHRLFPHSLPWFSHQSTVFSQFIDKELHTSKNIKNRLNRKNVCRILNCLNERLPKQDFTKGLIVYAGIDTYGKEIFEFIIPNIVITQFYYYCGSKFILDFYEKYMQTCSGNIIFANGDECIIYQFYGGTFIIKKRFNACLQKRQTKGGQSAVRIARLAEESRARYVTKIIDTLNAMNRESKMILYGSKEICKMIMNNGNKLVSIDDGGFMDFNIDTIKDTQTFINALTMDKNDIYDDKYEKILLYLDTDVDMLDFDIEMKDDMDYYVVMDNKDVVMDNKDNDNGIPLPPRESRFYSRFVGFEYIGVKYYADA